MISTWEPVVNAPTETLHFQQSARILLWDCFGECRCDTEEDFIRNHRAP